MGELVTFPSNGGVDQGWLAVPSSGHGPGVVVIQEWWGLVDHIKDVCERFAAEGFVALAPDLYHGDTVALKEPDTAQKHLMGLNIQQAAKDMSGAVDYLRGLPAVQGKGLGVVGFCMGGGLTLLLALQRPDAITAAVPFYGVVPPQAGNPDWSKILAAVQGHYAEDDDFAGPKAARALEQALKDAGKQAEIFLYPGTHHAFFNDDRPEVYDPAAAKQAWQRTIAFLRQTL